MCQIDDNEEITSTSFYLAMLPIINQLSINHSCRIDATLLLVKHSVITVQLFNLDMHQGKTGCPLTLVGLLPSEQKMSVLHFTVRRHAAYTEPVKSKERLLIQCGFRRFTCNPIFSDHSNLDKHKVC